MVNVGIIGYGYWGPRIVRNFYGFTDCKVVAVCDKRPEALQHVLASYSGIECTRDAQDIFMSKAIDAVAIVTPVSTHYELARQCLDNG
jgi:predicted dehydrogenase